MLFYFYIISIVFSVISLYMIMLSFLTKLKHDKIMIIENFSWIEEAKVGIQIIFKVCLPIFNLVYVIYLFLFYSSIYQKMVTKLFLQGNAVFENK